MFQPPPEDNRDQISEKPLPALPPIDSTEPTDETHPLAPNAPQGDDLFHHVFDCLNRGSSKIEVRKQLIAFGYTPAEAEETVEAVADYRRQHPEHVSIAKPGATGGNASMWIGGIICLVGILVTVGSCLAAGEGGGRYIVAWGAIIFGGIQFFRGLSQRNS